jgi:formylglycine-generating enzyme required for sulfatase activity
MKIPVYTLLTAGLLLLASCKGRGEEAVVKDSAVSCMQVPARYSSSRKDSVAYKGTTSLAGMVLVPGGAFNMGAKGKQSSPDEYPVHTVTVPAFYIDVTEVTNAQFGAFVQATGYSTTAEKKPDWNELKKTLPPGTPKPADSLLVAASLVFLQTAQAVDLGDYSQWWRWIKGASWQHPQGPASDIKGKENYPVVQVSWDDAMAYCRWAGKRLPTEAEWEFAARGGLTDPVYPWGNEAVNEGKPKLNSWDGQFPHSNTMKDGFLRTAPVKSFAPNGYGLYDMSGNVWEWCSDWYDAAYYTTLAGKTTHDPQGPSQSDDPDEPTVPKRALRGGSFLCNDSYCSGYRVARRMKTSPDTGLEHTGFRCVVSK